MGGGSGSAPRTVGGWALGSHEFQRLGFGIWCRLERWELPKSHPGGAVEEVVGHHIWNVGGKSGQRLCSISGVYQPKPWERMGSSRESVETGKRAWSRFLEPLFRTSLYIMAVHMLATSSHQTELLQGREGTPAPSIGWWKASMDNK